MPDEAATNDSGADDDDVGLAREIAQFGLLLRSRTSDISDRGTRETRPAAQRKQTPP